MDGVLPSDYRQRTSALHALTSVAVVRTRGGCAGEEPCPHSQVVLSSSTTVVRRAARNRSSRPTSPLRHRWGPSVSMRRELETLWSKDNHLSPRRGFRGNRGPWCDGPLWTSARTEDSGQREAGLASIHRFHPGGPGGDDPAVGRQALPFSRRGDGKWDAQDWRRSPLIVGAGLVGGAPGRLVATTRERVARRAGAPADR